MENSWRGQRTRTLVSGPATPRGFAHRPEDPNPAKPDPAGDNRTAATTPSPRRHFKQLLSICLTLQNVRQADPHPLLVTGAVSSSTVMVHSCHERDEYK